MENLKLQKGAAAVEFALLLPALSVLAFGIIEFSLFLYDQQMITNASREGARAGIVSSPVALTDGEIITVVDNYVSGNLITFSTVNSATTTIEREGLAFGDDLTVVVTYPYQFLLFPALVTNLMGVTTDGTLNLVATTVMKMEGSGPLPP
ncbi:MAG: TadE/TadG family type IV pilus assembly protein [Candidatus Scalinduaceae bacterium]